MESGSWIHPPNSTLSIVFSVIWCFMSLVVTFQVTLLMDKFASIVIPTEAMLTLTWWT